MAGEYGRPRAPRTRRLHVFGYAFDIDRADVLYASLLIQMSPALAAEQLPLPGDEQM